MDKPSRSNRKPSIIKILKPNNQSKFHLSKTKSWSMDHLHQIQSCSNHSDWSINSRERRMKNQLISMFSLLPPMASRLKLTLTRMRPSQTQSSSLKFQQNSTRLLLCLPMIRFSFNRNAKRSFKLWTKTMTSSQMSQRLRISNSLKLISLPSKRSFTCKTWKKKSSTQTTELTWSTWWTWASSTSKETSNCSKSTSITLS